MPTRYDDFESFDFETEDGYTVHVVPGTSGRANVAYLMLEWVEQAARGPALRYRWVGEVTPQVLNYSMVPSAGIALEGTQWLFFEHDRTRKTPAVFNLKVSMATWGAVIARLHAAWGLDEQPAARGRSFLS